MSVKKEKIEMDKTTNLESIEESKKNTQEELVQSTSNVVTDFKKIGDSMADPVIMNISNPTKLAGELSNLDFRTMIGGPLQAAIDAQIASSMAGVDFINQVGFTTDTDGKKSLVYIDFTHETSEYVTDADGNVNPTPQTTKKYMKVPFLAMLQIPSLRIEYVDINFKAKLNSVETKEVKDSLGVKVEAKGGWGPVSMKITASYQRQSSTGVKIEREFALDVKVRAVQDEMPKGLEMILNAIS